MPPHGLAILSSFSQTGHQLLTSASTLTAPGQPALGHSVQGNGSMATGPQPRQASASNASSYTPSHSLPPHGGHRWCTLKVRFYCDNRAVVICVQSGTSHCSRINLFLIAVLHNFSVSALHIPGLHNPIANSLSCFHMQAHPTCRLPPHPDFHGVRWRLYIETFHVRISHGHLGCFWCRFGIQEPLHSPYIVPV